MVRRRRTTNELGFVLPTRLMALSVSVVALAGLVLVATHGGDDSPSSATPASSTAGAMPTKAADNPNVPPPTKTPKPLPVVKRGKTNVVVFNNTNVKGLAGKTATRVEKAGWNVVTTDNWHGTVDTTTVYYGPKLKAAAQLLAADLGIARVKPSFAPMNPAQLTVILTAGYH